METFSDRLNYALKLSNQTQSSLAREVGIKPQSVQSICAGKVRSSAYSNQMAAFLNVSPKWLTSGIGPVRTEEQNRKTVVTGGCVPLIAWELIPKWQDIYKTEDEIECERWVQTICKPSSKAFALRVQGNSMESPTTPSFPNGYVITVDPSKPPKDKTFVIAAVDEGEPIFRQLYSEGGHQYLYCLNPKYPDQIIDVTGKLHIYGVVRELYQELD